MIVDWNQDRMTLASALSGRTGWYAGINTLEANPPMHLSTGYSGQRDILFSSTRWQGALAILSPFQVAPDVKALTLPQAAPSHCPAPTADRASDINRRAIAQSTHWVDA